MGGAGSRNGPKADAGEEIYTELAYQYVSRVGGGLFSARDSLPEVGGSVRGVVVAGDIKRGDPAGAVFSDGAVVDFYAGAVHARD